MDDQNNNYANFMLQINQNESSPLQIDSEMECECGSDSMRDVIMCDYDHDSHHSETKMEKGYMLIKLQPSQLFPAP